MEFIVSIDYGRTENSQLICTVLPAPHASDFHVSKILQLFCTRSNASPKSECLCPVLQLSRLEGRTAAPRSQSQVKNRPCAACNPGRFPTAPLCLLPPPCSLTAKAHLKHFQLNYFLCSGFSVPERTFSWKGGVI